MADQKIEALDLVTLLDTDSIPIGRAGQRARRILGTAITRPPSTNTDNAVAVFDGINSKTLKSNSGLSTAFGTDNTLFITAPSATEAQLVFNNFDTSVGAFFSYNDTSKGVSIGTLAGGLVFSAFSLVIFNSANPDTAPGYIFAQTGTNGSTLSMTFGTRDPEGVITANPGDVYFTQDGVNSDFNMLQNTVAANTGWRSVFAELDNRLPLVSNFGFIWISEEAAFPTQDGSTITCESGFNFVIVVPLTTAKRFIMEDGSTLSGNGTFTLDVTYTGSATMFTSSAAAWKLTDFVFSCTSATIFSVATGNNVLFQDVSCVSCTNVGTITSTGIINFVNGIIINITGTGLVIAGSVNIFTMTKWQLVVTTAVNALDIGTTTFNNFQLSNYEASGPASSFALSGTTASANINSNKIATVEMSSMNNDAMTPLENITTEDIRWKFEGNSGLADSRNTFDAFLTSAEVVTINTIGVFETVAGSNWSFTVDSRFTVTTAGVVTYIGELPLDIKVSGVASIEKVGGGTDELEILVALNGTEITRSGGTTENAAATSVPMEVLIGVVTNDTITVKVANNDSTANITVSKLSIVSSSS